MQNNNYWNDSKNRAIKAKEWVEKMERERSQDIALSVNDTYIYRRKDKKPYSDTDIILEALDSVSAVFKYDHPDLKTAVLNFASYKEPGGMFLNGSQAQEECLCHESTLYSVLKRFDATYYAKNKKALNRGLYQDVALYSPYVYFERDNNWVKCDVITCAAPNFTVASRFCNVSKAENAAALKSRIELILNLAKKQDVDILILGAFGSGVFGQDAREVAEITLDLLKQYKGDFYQVVFAVIDEKSANYQVFKDVIGTIKSVSDLEDVSDLDEITPDEITGTLGQLLDEIELPTELYDQVQALYSRATKMLK